MMKVLGRAITKADISYQTTGDAASGFICTIIVAELGKTFKGRKSEASEKLAVEAAAEVGLKAMKSTLAPLEAANAERKEAKKKAAMEMFAVKNAEKKAAKAAAKAAAEE